MDPQNMQYRRLQQQLRFGGQWYQNMGRGYGFGGSPAEPGTAAVSAVPIYCCMKLLRWRIYRSAAAKPESSFCCCGKILYRGGTKEMERETKIASGLHSAVGGMRHRNRKCVEISLHVRTVRGRRLCADLHSVSDYFRRADHVHGIFCGKAESEDSGEKRTTRWRKKGRNGIFTAIWP